MNIYLAVFGLALWVMFSGLLGYYLMGIFLEQRRIRRDNKALADYEKRNR